MKPLNKRKLAHCGKVAYALAVLVVLTAIFFLFPGGASATSDKPITYYVDAVATGANDGMSWDNAFTDLQSALDEAVFGDEIWVAIGTYKPSVRIDDSPDPRTAAFILKSGVKIYGGFEGDENQLHKRQLDPSLTVLSGDIGVADNDADNSYHVVYAVGVTDAVLDGFTVTGGRAGASVWGHRDNNGGGMYNDNSALAVSNCIFSDNKAFSSGGGMYNNNSTLTVSGCTFDDNEAGSIAGYFLSGRGGGMYNKGWYNSDSSSMSESSSIVTGCTFNDNWTHGPSPDLGFAGGGGMYTEQCAPTVDSCTFARNYSRRDSYYGGGMLNFMSWPTVTNCVFNANTSGRGGGMANTATGRALILNCTFYRNGWKLWWDPRPYIPYTYNGGAIFDGWRSSGSEIRDVIFSGNAVQGSGGAVLADEIRPGMMLTNCLFYENVRWDWDNYQLVSDHIKLYGFAPTMSDLLYDLDPLLADPEDGDFHLLEGSPCIDAGISRKDVCFANICWLPMPDTDFEGDKRFIDGDGFGGIEADIGADEYRLSED